MIVFAAKPSVVSIKTNKLNISTNCTLVVFQKILPFEWTIYLFLTNVF